MANKSIQAKFVEAWSGIENPDLDGINPHFKNRYATLKATLEKVRAACEPLGMAYVQTLKCNVDSFMLCSAVIDSEGGRMELSQYPVETVPNPQAFGSEMTYKKRQQAQADWGIVGEEDEDGEAAAAAQNRKTGQNTSKTKTAPPKANGAKPGRYAKLSDLKAQAMEYGITEEGMRGALGNILEGKELKDATDTEIKACEAAIAGLIRDKRELLGQEA